MSSFEIRWEYGIDDTRKEELRQKEWCGDAFVVSNDRVYRFEFISKRRLVQEASSSLSSMGYHHVDQDTLVIDNFCYEEIVATLERLRSTGYFDVTTH